MEFGVNQEALVWAPETISDADVKRFCDWVDIMMANTEELAAIEVNLDAVPVSVEPDSPVWLAVVASAEKFGLKAQRIFGFRGGFIKHTFQQPTRSAA